jgi:hypothetical protein
LFYSHKYNIPAEIIKSKWRMVTGTSDCILRRI